MTAVHRLLLLDAIKQSIDEWRELKHVINVYGSGGNEANQKLLWMGEVLCDYFHDNSEDLINDEIYEYVSQIVDNEFDFIPEDGSLDIFVTKVLNYYYLYKSGKIAEMIAFVKENKTKCIEMEKISNQSTDSLIKMVSNVEIEVSSKEEMPENISISDDDPTASNWIVARKKNYRKSYSSGFIQLDSSTWPIFPLSNAKQDLKSLLGSNKDNLKLEAMKRIISMIARENTSGDSAKELFPDVVKNIVTHNAELKKLIYIYLTHFAEQEQDLALLSISSVQKSLKDPNPLIRALALRVLSSIRVLLISPVILIAIKDCSNDMSPYVRKTAAHAISKLYSLDRGLKNEIITIIQRLLNDKTSIVLASAVIAFDEVCPNRFDLIQANYRKFVSLLPDFDEWGQIFLINVLIRYAKNQFFDSKVNSSNYDLLIHPDLRLLLRNAKPLLHSRNSAVVMAAVQLYITLAPYQIDGSIVKPLIRLLHSHREIQIVVLSNIVTLTLSTKDKKKCIKHLFEPYLKYFCIKAKDPTQVKLLKLKVLINLSNSFNITLILREFLVYIENYENEIEFVSATIKAFGKCSSKVKEVALLCLNGLIPLLSNKNKSVVSQIIIVITSIIIENYRNVEKEKQKNKDGVEIEYIGKSSTDSAVGAIIKQVIKSIDKIETPHARASIVWILAKFCDKNDKSLKMSPDILRIIAKNFTNEANLVKLQALNLASKLYLKIIVANDSNMDEKDKAKMRLLINYVFNLAKYDVNYDIRDRGRFLKSLLNGCDSADGIELANRLLMNKKMAYYEDNEILEYTSPYRIGSLSHYIDRKLPGYEEFTEFCKPKEDMISPTSENSLSKSVVDKQTIDKEY